MYEAYFDSATYEYIHSYGYCAGGVEMSEHEIAVLFMLKTMQVAIPNRYLIEIFAEAEIIEYFLGLDILHKFEEEELIRIGEMGGITHYKIAPKGKEACELFENKLPKEIKERIEKCCLKVLSGDHDLNKVYTQITALRENIFYFKCGIFEQNEPLLELRVRSNDAEQMERMGSFFRKHSAEMYPEVLKILGEKEDLQ